MAKIVLYCCDVFGEHMAGPAIRYWEFAKVLSKNHDVTIVALNQPDISEEFKIISRDKVSWSKLLKNTDIIITQHVSYFLAILTKIYSVKIILDAYDPMPLEILEIFKEEKLSKRIKQNKLIINQFNFSFSMSDGFICANERQKNLWIGLLLSLKKITPDLYNIDDTLTKSFKIVPFGLPSKEPVKTNNNIRKKFGIKETDKVLLWGGGIWNWFDPLTLLYSIKELSEKRNDIKLIFMGIKHPNNNNPTMKMVSETISLARELDLLDKYVFINYGWTPYDERQNFLLEADIGVSTHFTHLETQFAFRTRILDYIWAGLPIIATEGDSFSELIDKHQLGRIVPEKNIKSLSRSIEELLDDSSVRSAVKNNLNNIKSDYYWENIVKSIDELINHLQSQQSKAVNYSELVSICFTFIKDKGLIGILEGLRNKTVNFLQKRKLNRLNIP